MVFLLIALHTEVRRAAICLNLVDLLRLVRREHANPVQFLVSKVRLLLVAGPFYLAQSRFPRDTVELLFRYAK